MITIKKGWKRYPVINTPISKHYLVELLEKYPNGIYVNNGKKIEYVNSNTAVSRYDIKIDFFNSAKVLGLILGLYYIFSFKKKVKKKVKENLYNTEERLKDLRNEVEKRVKDSPSFYSDEEQ